jgi:outer membrane protein TolC
LIAVSRLGVRSDSRPDAEPNYTLDVFRSRQAFGAGALATAYFNLRAADALRELLERTVKEYKTTLEIVQNQFNSGYAVSKADVATAEAQVFATEAQALNVGVQRAQFEHAIAMLIGRPPAELTIAMYPLA